MKTLMRWVGLGATIARAGEGTIDEQVDKDAVARKSPSPASQASRPPSEGHLACTPAHPGRMELCQGQLPPALGLSPVAACSAARALPGQLCLATFQFLIQSTGEGLRLSELLAEGFASRFDRFPVHAQPVDNCLRVLSRSGMVFPGLVVEQFNQLSHLLDAEFERLHPLDQQQALDIILAVESEPASGAGRRSHQSDFPVVADGPEREPGPIGNLADLHVLAGHSDPPCSPLSSQRQRPDASIR